MGCALTRETVEINGYVYQVRSRIAGNDFSIASIDLVENMRSHKQYALKRILCLHKSDESQAFQEVEFHNQIKHPFILSCIDSSICGTADILRNTRSEVFLLFPYHSRGSLQDEINQRNSCIKNHFSEEYILRLFLKICLGVEAIHNAKPVALAHRDLKPENILITLDDNPVISNFGSMGKARHEIKGCVQAKNLQDMASERCCMPYRAPELFNVENVCTIDERSDIWSLGCILYAMCFFKSPFEVNRSRQATDLPHSVEFEYFPETSRYLSSDFDAFYKNSAHYPAGVSNVYNTPNPGCFCTFNNDDDDADNVICAALFSKCLLDLVTDGNVERKNVKLKDVIGKIIIPKNSPYSPALHDLIHSVLIVDPMERPFIDDVIKHVDTLLETSSV